MLRISWRYGVTNEVVLRSVGVERELMKLLGERQLCILLHGMRRREPEKCLLDWTSGTKPRQKYLDGLVRTVGGDVSATHQSK